ncbi:MAG: ADP-ribosylglycohydrolase family protein [Anaerolineae bacterium]|nr:ADP-ribosylglycohydrolase family protein [Anaerolineae bacterium]
MAIPHDYAERVYAGVLGKIIGVYLGRPFEGWTYDHIMAELGEINYYVHERLNKPLIVTDDDISGTFTFLRALPDYGNRRDVTAAQIGQTWLNYLIEGRTVLWWGDLGNSTEHTAYLRLKSGIPAPDSGSIRTNGKIVAEQIGAQIFIDGWGMVSPGDPELAADLARRAASVSHDGEAIYGAQVVAAIEAQAFVESDINNLLDTAVTFIPRDSVIYRLIHDIRDWHAEEKDWHKAREWIAAHYGYDKYGGNCHMVPNHALIILGILYGDDDFQKSLMIANTAGWDTDCNSGNVGCIMGIKNGLAGIDAGPDWRGPVRDRLFIPTADGGRCLTNAVTEAYHIINVGRALAGLEPVSPKGGARFHFEFPGAVQGFGAEDSVECRGTVTVANVAGHSRKGERSLALHYKHLAPGRAARVATPTFIPPEATNLPGYGLMASPSLYPGQIVRAGLSADTQNASAVSCNLYIRHYGANDQLVSQRGPLVVLKPGDSHEFAWQIGDLGSQPIAEVGVELSGQGGAHGTVYLDYLTWDGAPSAVLGKPETGGNLWRRAWVDGMDKFGGARDTVYRIRQNYGLGLAIQGCREWTDYEVSAAIRPDMVKATGLAVRVQGMRRYYAFLLVDRNKARLVKCLDGNTVLAEKEFPWEFFDTYEMTLKVVGNKLEASINGKVLLRAEDTNRPLTGGGVALVCEEGCISTDSMTVRPAQ